ncbi:hypothetical protein CTAYLR_000172 [Chrysophaeum taylorii]|uniref:S1 motif domain-containing protein n=1 Tax=Chrysophaeum taylorii TaxID=2483200 RepID=A0AAD7UI93_9STRA|nr:hypothetical protein CTAYLR_000172 [Chrysophaeum taylorii]
MYRRQREKDRRRPLPVTRSLASISEGEWYEGIVQKTRENGAFVSIGAEVDGFVHAKDISDSEFVDARTLRRGEALSVCVKFVDVDRKVLSLSAIPYERTDAYLSATNSKGLMDFAIDVKVHNATIIRTTKYAAFVDIGAKVPAYLHYADIGLEPRMRVGGPREPILQPRPGLQIDECWIKDIEFARHRVRITTIPPDLRDDPHINPPPKPEYLKYLQYQQHRDSPPHPDDDYHYF